MSVCLLKMHASGPHPRYEDMTPWCAIMLSSKVIGVTWGQLGYRDRKDEQAWRGKGGQARGQCVQRGDRWVRAHPRNHENPTLGCSVRARRENRRAQGSHTGPVEPQQCREVRRAGRVALRPSLAAPPSDPPAPHRVFPTPIIRRL